MFYVNLKEMALEANVYGLLANQGVIRLSELRFGCSPR
jgi:hypothetical protein